MTQIKATRHALAVNDLAKSDEYSINVLGLSREFATEGWEFLARGNFRVMLGECPDEVPAAQTNNHSCFAYALVDDVDTLYKDLQSRGATFKQTPQDKPWGLREFGIVTPDGHRVMFGQEIGQTTE